MRQTIHRWMIAAIVGGVACLSSPAWTQETPKVPDYVQHIAPIFQTYCTSCHNDDDREGGLSLESYADLQQGGDNGPALFAGQVESRLLLMVEGKLEPKMPPDNAEGPPAADIALLKAWVDSGAKGPAGAEPKTPSLLTPKLPSPEHAADQTSAMALSPQGDLLAVGQFGRVKLLEAATGAVRFALTGIAGKVNSVTFSRDGRHVIVASGIAGLHGQATIWDATTGQRTAEFIGHRDTMYDAELSPDGKLLATCGYDRKILLWNPATREVVRTLEGHNGAVFEVAFSPDGESLASASADETVKLWRVESGERLDTLSQPEAEQYAVAFSPDGEFVVAGGADNRIRVWRFISRKEPRINPILHARFAHEGAILDLAFSPDGSLLASSAEDGTLKVWNTDSYLERHLFPRQSDLMVGLAITPEAQNVMVARLDGVREVLPIPAAQSRPAAGGPSAAGSATAQSDAPVTELAEQEPNNGAAEAMSVAAPARIKGVIHAASDSERGDADCYRFTAQAGEQWMVEINAARQKSPLDSRVEVLTSDGRPIPRVQLQAVRDSYFTFRGKDSDTIDDFRVHNWEEMELNEYLYAGGEVVKLWLWPRGPDSGFKVYPGSGKRYNFFDTTPMSHALHEPCYIVRPSPPGTELIPNGLPVFHLFYENDDDALRAWGADSRLTFTAPADGEYLVRVTDVRGFQGPEYTYELTLRPRQPDFEVTLSGADPTVGAGSGREFVVNAQRKDGFEGEIRVDLEGLPPGFHVTTPIVIEEGQISATGIVYADLSAPAPTAENAKASRVVATAVIDRETVTRDVNNLGEIKLGDKPKLLVRLLPAEATETPSSEDWQPWELAIRPGETITARVKIERNGFDGRVPFGNEDSGRNLPHGVIVDNIGLNGLLIVEGKDERTFFLTAAKWVPGQTRWFYLKSRVEGDQTSWPIQLHVAP